METTELNVSKLLDSRSSLLNYLRTKVLDRDLAEDILQESLLKAMISAPQLRDEDRLLPWFYSILNNAVTDVYRKRRVVEKYIRNAQGEGEEVVEPVEQGAICACIYDVLPTLKPEYAEVIREMELKDGDSDAVAEALGITRNNLKVRRHRARTQLRERLEQTCRACATHGCLDCSCKQSNP